MYLHPANCDMEKFYADFVPKACLPSDLGGDLPDTIAELHEKHCKEMLDMRDYFAAEEKQAKLEFDNTQ